MHKKAYSTWKNRPVAMGLFLLSMWVFLPRMVLAQLMQVEQVSQPTGFVSDTQVVEVGNEFTTLLPDLSSNGYIFGYWKMGEERLADGQGRSVVQPTVEVSAAITLTAHYFLETEDTDGDGVRDWFEWRNFGTLYQGQQDDADGDGFTNGQEDALGQEPTIFDEVEDGGVPARRSSPFTYADTSMVKYTMKSDPLGFVDTTERFVEINGTTTSANLHGESNGYTFAYWSVNGVRQAAGAGVAVSQVTTRVEDTTVAIAHYLPTTEDSDGDGVADWFELNQFGDLNSGPQDDADGDSFSNAHEEALGQEATILDEVEDGGVTARRSPAFVYADTSMVAYLIKSDPLGFVDQTAGFVEQNASVTTPSQHGESNGYTFAYWSVDGVRQVSPNGLSLSQVTVAINAPATLVAHYLPTTEDSDGDGVEDWFEIYQFGDLGQSPDDDMDGDGFSNRQENELGQEALIIDEVEDGGVTARRSKSVLYYQQQNYAPSGLDLNNTITFTNLPADTLVGGLTPTDLNDAHLEDNYTYSLLTGSGGDDYAQYSLSGKLLNTANLFAVEANHSLLIRVTDSEGLSFDKNFTIQVLDPALDPDGDGLTNQQEWIAGTRHDHSDTDGDGFSDSVEITAGTNPLDAEDFPNDAPTDLNSTDVLTVAENQPAGTLVGEFNATDPDGDIIVYSLVNGQGDTDNDFFLLDENGTLTTASVLDYEAGDVRTIRVQASDPHGASIQGVFTVQVTNDVTDDVEATFTVSGGQHQAPFFTFTDHNGDTPDFSTLHLKKGAIYEFISSNISGGHTFMIGGSYGDTSSEHVSDNVLNSYQNGQKLTLTIPSDFSGELYYFCTYHSHMVQPFLIGRPTHTVDLNSTVNLEMIWVEPGTFTMGSPTTEEGRSDNETQHEVTLTKGFYLGKYEVTQAQYDAVMETAPIDTVLSPDQLTDLELWLDANHSSASSGTWQDRSSKGNNAIKTGSPSVIPNAHNGLPLMVYNANGQRHKFSMLTNIRTVFWVISQDVSVNGSGFRYLLSDSTKHPHWHNQNNGKFWSSNGWTHNHIKDGVTRMNGSKINGITTNYPNNLSIISVRTTGDVHADNFGYERGITDRQWKGNLGELVIFSKALSDLEIEKVEGYLAQKWGLISNLSISHSYNPNRNSSPSMFEGNPNRPVEQVSWDDVQIFLKRLNEQETDNLPTGWSYVLPTEAEWEYACRAGTRTAYSWGDDINSSFANYNIGQTSNVGNYAANPWGFFDMHGNVLEWVSDDLGTQDIHSHRGVRGGAYSSSANYIRSARRAHADPSVRRAWIGFRLAFRQITEPPINLNSVAELTVFENQPIGTIVGEFNATDPDGESRYEIISGVEMSWQEAREDALSRGGHLVTITSQEENNIITSLLESAGYPDDGPYWVGMHEVGQGGSSAGQFQWVTGEAIDYTNWQASHPEYNGGTRAVYVTTINTNNLGKWYDWRDDPTSKCNGYMLELPPVVSYHLVAGEGDGNNSLFTLDTNGTLRTATVFNYETNASTYTIRVQAKDELNASAEEDFTVTIYDVYEGPPNMWDNGTDLGNGWKNISWFGNFNGFNSSWWIYHDALGWSFGAGVSLSHFWLYHTELGWLWTGAGIYPYLYSSDQGTWLYIDNKDGNAMYFNVSSSQWVTFSDGGPGAGIYPQTWDSNRFYDVGDLVWSGGETFIATVGSNNQEPPNTNYWTNLIEVHQALGLPVEDLPTLDTTTILSSLSDLNPPETSRPTDLNSTDPLTISKNQIVGSIVGQFSATDPNGGVVTYQFVNGDNNNSLFSLDVNGTLRTASTFLNHSSSSIYTIKVRAKNDDNAFVENTFEVILTDILENLPPRDLNTTEPLSFSENLPIGIIVGEFNATDPDGDILNYHFVSGDNNNSLFTLDQNGTLRTAVMFDFESNASSYSINVKVSDGKGGEVQGVFTLLLIDNVENEIRVISQGGTVSWVGGTNYLVDQTTGQPLLNELGIPLFSYNELKFFRGSEDFVFTGDTVTLRPEPDTGNVFTYWLIDGVPTLPDGLRLATGGGSMIVDNSAINGIIFDDNRTFPDTVQAIFSPIPVGSESNQSLAPVALPPIDMTKSTTLNEMKVEANGGTVSWVGGTNYLLNQTTGSPKLDEKAQPIFSYDELKFFRGSEDFVFTGDTVVLRPEPDTGNVFTYWLIDGVPTLPDGLRLAAGGGSMILNSAINGIIFDNNRTFPDTVQAIFSPIPVDSESNQSLAPIDLPPIDITKSATLKEIKVEAKGGTVSWVRGTNFLVDQTTGAAKLDEKGQPILDYNELKFFRGSERFVFTGDTVTLRPEPYNYSSFSHWLIDGVPTLPDGLRLAAGGGSMIVDNSAINGIIFDENRSFAESVIAVFETNFLSTIDFNSSGKMGIIGSLTEFDNNDLKFQIDSNSPGFAHHFFLEENGTLRLVEDFNRNEEFNFEVVILLNGKKIESGNINIKISGFPDNSILNANTSDSAYHESALMIRELKVVQEDNRNGHNPISSIAKKPNTEGLFVTTAQPHGRKVGDSVVLSGVQGLQIEGLKNWNFMVDEVTEKSFRIRHFGKGEDGNYSGELGQLAKAVAGTEYIGHKKDYLLGAWTFGHLLGNMVGEQDDPVTFYKHFVDQWNHNQVVNGWDSGIRKISRFTALNDPNLTLANLPFRLLAIGNRLDLFHAKSIRQVDDAGEGRFVFTNVSTFNVPENEDSIWKVHEVSTDEPPFTLIFEYGQPASNFAELSSWAKDWHKLEVKVLDGRGNFTPTQQYLSLLNDLTDRFTKRGAHSIKPNGNPINQVRTNEVFGGVWQMREFNLLPKADAENVKSSPDRTTKLIVSGDLNVTGPGLWTTTTKNNPMIGSGVVEQSLVPSLARWINQREYHILDGTVGPPAPSWMEGPVANQPGGFTYSKDFGFSGVRTNLARYKYSLSTCSGCHNGDTGTPFQMVSSRGKSNKAIFEPFMVGNKKGGPFTVADSENENEKHEFFDLRDREVIVRDILDISQKVDSARLRLSRTEIDRSSGAGNSLATAFVQGGVIGDWEYELPDGKFDNEFFDLSKTGDLTFDNQNSLPDFGYNQIFVRARATDGTGVVIERPYALWILKPNESKLAEDLDPSVQPDNPPAMSTPRPNRTH